jgi:hypothetical protein
VVAKNATLGAGPVETFKHVVQKENGQRVRR